MSKNSLNGFNESSEAMIKPQGNAYIYTVHIKNNSTNKEKGVKITMQLKEETNFTTSIEIYDI